MTMPVLTVRISEDEKARIVSRARKAGLTTGALVRELIAAPPFVTAADLLAELESLMGEKRLRIKPRK
jgi:hypothetical protein